MCRRPKGFFKEQGVDMEFLPGQGSGDALRNVIAGNADIAFCGPEAIYLAADKGSQLKAVYDIYPVNVFNVFALKNKQIITPLDLKGKKIGVISMASGTRYNLATILALNGMSERDVELVALGHQCRARHHRGQGRCDGLDRLAPLRHAGCRPRRGRRDLGA